MRHTQVFALVAGIALAAARAIGQEAAVTTSSETSIAETSATETAPTIATGAEAVQTIPTVPAAQPLEQIGPPAESESTASVSRTTRIDTTAPATATAPVQSNATTATVEARPETVPSDSATSVSTPEGVLYQVLKPGTGPVETTTHTLLLHYTLYLPDGRKLESSRDAEFPVPLKLKRNTDSFIKGFEIGTQGMRVGEIRKMYIPAELGYGEKGNEAVPPNTPLVFEAELVDLK